MQDTFEARSICLEIDRSLSLAAIRMGACTTRVRCKRTVGHLLGQLSPNILAYSSTPRAFFLGPVAHPEMDPAVVPAESFEAEASPTVHFW